MTYVVKRHTTWLNVLTTLIILIRFQFNVILAQSANGVESNIDNSITFDLPLTVTWETEDGEEYELTAFRSKTNDAILDEVEKGKTRNVPKLLWASSGRPTFVEITGQQTMNVSTTKVIGKFFRFTPSGFFSKIKLLTNEQKNLLAQKASRETHVNITSEQIINLPLSKFMCFLTFRGENGREYLIKGKVGNFRQFPLRMDFIAPIGTTERARLIAHSHVDDMIFSCHMAINAKKTRTNSLSITSEQLQEIRLEDKLFGDAREVYVTRHQMSQLASEMYSSLNIVEDYEMPESAFSEAFVDGIIGQLSIQQFSQVPIDTLLASISRYTLDFSGDLTADRITSELDKVLKVEEVGNKARIVAERSRATSNEHSTSKSEGGSGKIEGDGWGFNVAVEAAYNYANNNAQKNSEDVRSLDDQLKELNQLSKNDVEWKIEGDKVIPKSLNVTKLSRTRIGNKLSFSRIQRQTSDVVFNQDFTMYLLTDELPDVQDESILIGNSSQSKRKNKREDEPIEQKQTDILQALLEGQTHLLNVLVQQLGVNSSISQQLTGIGQTVHNLTTLLNREHPEKPPGWILVQQHNGSIYFNRGWNDYKNGFGDLNRNYWIGNDRLHQLTSWGLYKVRFELLAKYNSQWYWAEYNTFRVGDESTNYALTVTGYNGNAGNSFGNHNGYKFATRDRVDASGCAAGNLGNSGGFWYRGCCNGANINGSPLLHTSVSLSSHRGFMWYDLPIGSSPADRKLLVSRMWLVPQ